MLLREYHLKSYFTKFRELFTYKLWSYFYCAFCQWHGLWTSSLHLMWQKLSEEQQIPCWRVSSPVEFALKKSRFIFFFAVFYVKIIYGQICQIRRKALFSFSSQAPQILTFFVTLQKEGSNGKAGSTLFLINCELDMRFLFLE